MEGLPDGFPCEPKPNAPGGFGLAAAILDLPERSRRLAILDVVQYQLMRMAAREGWATAPLRAAYDACVADGLELHLVSKPKASPDRRLTAHVAYTIDGNGDGRTTLHVQDRGGESVHRSEAWDSPNESHTFTRIGQSLRWLDRRTVNVYTWPGVPPPKKHFPVEHTVELPADPPAG
ncbi:hypothetical protein [Catellatospora sichuanensis]|uniref:hypothetical protein n=1 Tax=Catellatospora sichuanensis TaxID=1969805 RepID=UPI001183A867|nr:hypothetical protein [Catellatospora sichuanensis]